MATLDIYHLIDSRSNKNDDLKKLKAELADPREEAKADALRRLPLYSCRITGFRFVCSRCYDKVNKICQSISS